MNTDSSQAKDKPAAIAAAAAAAAGAAAVNGNGNTAVSKAGARVTSTKDFINERGVSKCMFICMEVYMCACVCKRF